MKHEDRTPEWHSWAGMHTRCTNPRQKSFKDYGGRGIAVDPRWRDFAKFLKEVREFDRSRLDRQDQITYDVLVDQYQTALSFQRFDWLAPDGLYAINPMLVSFGEHSINSNTPWLLNSCTPESPPSPEAAGLHELPGHQPRNSQSKFPHPSKQ